jgi:integrative and conjugative element protein (TIGR02256 family)
VNDLASEQLAELARVSQGAIQLLGESDDKGIHSLTISLETQGINQTGGIRIRDRERFQIVVQDSYPYKPPSVWVAHRRWAGTPHVQWGRHLCLYAAPSVEWNPADGMRGLVARLSLWLQRAAAGALDPDGQPLHPPVAYASKAAGQIVIRPDLEDRVPWADTSVAATNVIWAWCVTRDDRVDVIEWLDTAAAFDRALADDFQPIDPNGNAYVIAPLLLISREIAFEYPKTARLLAAGLEESGMRTEEILSALTRGAIINRYIESQRSSGAVAGFPNLVLLGTPSRRGEGDHRLAHISAWKLDDFGEKIAGLLAQVQYGAASKLKPEVVELAHAWLASADVLWMSVQEARSEVTRRRDGGTAASWLLGKRVLILGAGALGAPVAEHCVRAGVGSLTVADNGIVTPGILVRQPYSDQDIGNYKAKALAERLNHIRPDLVVTDDVGDIVDLFSGETTNAPTYDLIIDATADVGVRTTIEVARLRHRADWPPLVTMIIGHEATRGIVGVSARNATGGGSDLLRRVAIRARGSAGAAWRDIAEDFFPNSARTDMFFPEPGCSSPTFVGSSIQANALSSQLFNLALESLSLAERDPSAPPMYAAAIRLTGATGRQGVDAFTWENDLVLSDAKSGFEIRLSRAALNEMRAEARRGARTRGELIETGGMLLGAIDESTRVAYLDVAAGPPPDSALSSIYFDHGTLGTQEIVDRYRSVSAQAISFVGMWHTHPYGRPRPSETDELGMGSVLSFPGSGRRALMVIVGGDENDRWRSWRDDDGDPDAYVRMIDRSETTRTGAHAGFQVAPVSTYFPGGYGFDASTLTPDRKRAGKEL